jgi:uncharacterized protein YutE (UPF0331/DUF86 family)
MYMNKVTTTINQLKTYSEDISNQNFFEKVLRTLCAKFIAMVVAIEDTIDTSKITIDDLIGFPLSHDAILDRNENSSLENSFQTQP